MISKFRETKVDGYRFPNFLFVDTSFLLNSFVPVPEKDPTFPNRTNISCSDFLQDLRKRANDGEVCLFTDDYVLNEFFYFIIKSKVECVDFLESPFDVHVQEYKKNNRNPLSSLLKDHPELITKHFPVLEDYYERIRAVPIAILAPDYLMTKSGSSISDRMNELIKQYEILPADALHIAIAQQAGIKDFVVIDADFHKVSEINIFTCISNRKPCGICPPS